MADAPETGALEAPIAESTESQENIETIEGQEAAPEGEMRTDAEIEADKNLTKTEKQQEKRLKKLSLKFNGKEYDEELPFEIPDTPEAIEYMRKNLQLSKLSQTKSEEAATWERQAIEFVKALREDPESVLSDPTIGVDMKKLAAKIIERDIENSKKTPEQLKLEEAQNELKKLKADREREQKESKDREFEKLTEHYYKQYETDLNNALEKSTLPKSPEVVNRIADYLEFAAQNKISVSVAEVVPLVEADFKEQLKQMFAIMPEDVIEEFIGKDVFNKVRKKNLAKAKANMTPALTKTSSKDIGQVKKSEEKPKAKLNYKNFFGV